MFRSTSSSYGRDLRDATRTRRPASPAAVDRTRRLLSFRRNFRRTYQICSGIAQGDFGGQGYVSLPGQVGDRAAIANFGPREYLPTPTANSRHEARPYLPTPPPALNSESARPPGGRSGTCLPLRGACLSRDHTYLPSRRFFQLPRSPTCLGKETQPRTRAPNRAWTQIVHISMNCL